MAKEGKVIGNIEQTQPVMPTRWISPFDEIERMFDEFMGAGLMRPGLLQRGLRPELQAFEGRMPRVDVLDRESEFVVRAELPGVDKKDLDISLGENSLTIKASSSHESKEESGDYYRREISRGSFARTVPLPGTVDSEKVKADFNNGILEITLPKLEQSKRRRIEVS